MAVSRSLAIGESWTGVYGGFVGAGWAFSPRKMCMGNHRPESTSVEEGQVNTCSWLLHSAGSLDLTFPEVPCFEPLSLP